MAFEHNFRNMSLDTKCPSTNPTLPHDILHRIFTEHLTSLDGHVDFQTLGALSLAHRGFRAICRPIQFGNIEFNFRRRNVRERVREFTALLQADNTLKNDIRGVSIRDNVIHTSMERLRPTVALAELQDAHRYLTHYNMEIIPTDEDPYTLIDSSRTSCGLQFAKALMQLRRLRSLDVSFLYFPIDWRIMSPEFRGAMTNMISAQPFLLRLSLHGLNSIPPHFLENFDCLEELNISLCSIRSYPCGYAFIEPPSELNASQRSGKIYRNRLKFMSVECVSGRSTDSLVKSWKKQGDSRGRVDMIHPSRLQLFFQAIRHTAFARKILAEGAYTITHLHLNTSRMGRIMTFPQHPLSPNVIELEDTKDIETTIFPVRQLQGEDIAHLHSLETLEFSVVYWEHVAANGRRAEVELQWALELLQAIPPHCMRHFILKIKVGGFLIEAEEALKEFHDAQEAIWRDWKRELALPKWNALKSVRISIWMLSTGERPSATAKTSKRVIERLKSSLSTAFKGKTS